jgi:lipoprotein-anchoring transpeptidase ErfK/SrfK
VDGMVELDDTSGPYGAYQISVAAFSEVHYSFGGGNGQIAIHGTNDPALIGTPASNGCVRMTNEDITHLTTLAQLGTPVQIV